MATTSTESKNFFENVLDAQKQVLDSVKSTAENFAKQFQGNPMEANTEMFQKWYEEQMSFLNKSAQINPFTAQQYQEMFAKWMNMQMGLFKDFMEKAQGSTQTGQNTWNDFQKMFQGNDFVRTYSDIMQGMNTSLNQWLGFLSNKDTKGAFEGMMDNMNQLARFSEIWMPMMKQMQENYKNVPFFNPELVKNLMNQMFSMAPDSLKTMTEDWSKIWNSQNGQWMDNFKSMRNQFTSAMSGQASDLYKQLNEGIGQFYTQLNNASSPLMKMMTPGTQREQIESVSRISQLISEFTLLNNQMSSLMYMHGMEAFEKLAEKYQARLKEGETLPTMTASYQEWLNLNDQIFTEWFSGEEYSKLQAKLASTGMRLKREMDLQMEKALGFLPVINRTEMDDLYQTIYDLKKRIAELERQNIAVDEEAVRTSSKGTTKKK